MKGESVTLVEFIESKIADVEKHLKFRVESETSWRGGTEESWKLASGIWPGTKHMTKRERLEVADRDARIATKTRIELRMFKAVLEKLKAAD